MTRAADAPPLDLASTALRGLVLYGLMEFQSGHASTLWVSAQGAEFGIADDGRGHPLDKRLAGTNYIDYIYTHFDYPFEAPAGQAGPVQLQGIGMSLVNALCCRLVLTVRKPEHTLTRVYENGQLASSETSEAPNERTGVSVQCRLRPELPAGDVGMPALEDWLRGLVRCHPTLKLFLNGRALTAGP